MSHLSYAVAAGLLMPAAQSFATDAALAEFFKAYLEESFRLEPVKASRLGDHRFDHLLDDLSPAARSARTELARRTLAELPRKIDYAKLTRSGQIDFEIFRHNLDAELKLDADFKPFETDPRVYNEYISDSVFLLFTQSTLPAAQNIKNAAARIAFIPQVVAAAKANLKNPPRVVTETAIRQNRGSIGFYETDIFEVAGVAPGTEPLATPAMAAAAALRDYQKFLENDLLPRATGEWRIGRERFARKLELELDSGITADQVLAEAEAEFARVERDLYVIARQMWSRVFPKTVLPADDEAGRRETVRRVLEELGNEHGKPEELVVDARATVAAIKAFIAEHDILRLPEPDRCQVLEMPEFQRGNSIAYLSSAPPLDPNASSVYAVSPPPKDWGGRQVLSFLKEYNRHMLKILTIHEAYPGHYVQLEFSNRHPSLIRRVLGSGVFAEGWAVYTEQMMLDQGFGAGDPALRMHQLKFYLRAVGNAILDHKLHCGVMTDEQAMSLMIDRAFQSEGEAKLKLIRAKQTSCQLSTYFVGRTAFYKLRQTIQREQGEAFHLGRFHEAALSNGTLPVKYLPEVTRERLKQAR